jgi:hypothetical protein
MKSQKKSQLTDELYQYLVCDYYATGEGRTVCLLITRAYPHTDDYETRGNFDHGVYTPGTLKKGMSDKTIAAREFVAEFGSWYAQGAENLIREEFLKRFGHYLPDYVHNILNAEVGEIPGNFNFKQTLHINFS